MEEFCSSEEQVVMVKGTDFKLRGVICAEVCRRRSDEGKRVAVFCTPLMRFALQCALNGDAVCYDMTHISYANGGRIWFVDSKSIRRARPDVLVVAVDGINADFLSKVVGPHKDRGTKLYILCGENDVELQEKDGGSYIQL